MLRGGGPSELQRVPLRAVHRVLVTSARGRLCDGSEAWPRSYRPLQPVGGQAHRQLLES